MALRWRDKLRCHGSIPTDTFGYSTTPMAPGLTPGQTGDARPHAPELSPGSGRVMARGTWAVWSLLAVGFSSALIASEPTSRLYSTAPVPRSYIGLRPERLASNEVPVQATAPSPKPAPVVLPPPLVEIPQREEEPPKIASVPDRSPRMSPKDLASPPAEATPSEAAAAEVTPEIDPIVRAKQMIAECKAKFATVRDYTCSFHKRERIQGKMTPQYVMSMKARTHPHSIYFKFVRPYAGREAIYVSGKNSNKLLAHDVGIGKFVAGTLQLDVNGSRAMEDNRHPVNEAGIGALIDNVATHWAVELQPGESVLTFSENVLVGTHSCTMIDSTHPSKAPGFLFHKVRLFIDHEHGLPIRIEAYDWPKKPGVAPELVEEYTYMNLRTNVGLREADFDVANAQYSFGRF